MLGNPRALSYKNNFTINETNREYSSVNEIPLLLRVINAAIYSCIIFFGVIGNCLIIAAVARWKKLQNPCNIFISNISAVDILYLLVAGYLRITEFYIPWPFGKTACPVISPLQDVFVCVSVMSHTIISWERHRAVVTPFKQKITYKVTVILLIATWSGCYLTVGLPIALVYQQTTLNKVLYCIPKWSKLFSRVYLMSVIFLFVITPVIIQSTAYTRIIRILYRPGNTVIEQNCLGSRISHNRVQRRTRSLDSKLSRNSSQAWFQRRKKKEKLIKMLCVQVVTFQVCWLIRSTVIVMQLFGIRGNFYIGWGSTVLYYVQQVANPIILFSMSSDFRRSIKNCFSKLCEVYARNTGKGEEYILTEATLDRAPIQVHCTALRTINSSCNCAISNFEDKTS